MAESLTSVDSGLVPTKNTLDDLIIKGLDVIEEILEEQKKLELSLREGFIFMSKARYSMGTKSVGVLQLPTEDGRQIDALAKVNHVKTNDNSTVDYLDFFVMTGDETDTNSSKTGSDDTCAGDGLRQRGPSKNRSNGGGNESHANKKKTDPLNWFGVLVPQALRSSQQIFQDNVQSVCRLASLRSHLEAIRIEYAKLSKEVADLNTIKSLDNLKIN